MSFVHTIQGWITTILTYIKMLYHMILRPIKGNSHAERLEDFYKEQAGGYDAFRKNMLYGYDFLDSKTPTFQQGIWVDMGGGTGKNVQHLADKGRLGEFSKIYIVDLTPSLLAVAKERIQRNGWKNVFTIEADATSFIPPDGPKSVDFATFTYSLTMMPDWFIAIDNAKKYLKPSGTLAVIDFFVSRKYPAEGMVHHGWLTRTFWPIWFANDNVIINQDQIPYLRHHFQSKFEFEAFGTAPIFTFLAYPYHVFIGTNSKTN